MGRDLVLPESEVIAGMMTAQNPGWVDGYAENLFWPAMLRKAARDCPGFDDL